MSGSFFVFCFGLSLECGCFINVAESGSMPFNIFVLVHPPLAQWNSLLSSACLHHPISLSPSLLLEDRRSSCRKMHQNYFMRQINISKRIAGLFCKCSILKNLKTQFFKFYTFLEINELVGVGGRVSELRWEEAKNKIK